MSELRQERKVVTVLFADLVGFTARSEQLDPEDVAAVLRPYHERLRSELERFGGTVEKFIGDAVMALFGAPVAHEDDPERAVRAALAIRDWAREEESVQVRIAENQGEADVARSRKQAEQTVIMAEAELARSRRQAEQTVVTAQAESQKQILAGRGEGSRALQSGLAEASVLLKKICSFGDPPDVGRFAISPSCSQQWKPSAPAASSTVFSCATCASSCCRSHWISFVRMKFTPAPATSAQPSVPLGVLPPSGGGLDSAIGNTFSPSMSRQPVDWSMLTATSTSSPRVRCEVEPN